MVIASTRRATSRSASTSRPLSISSSTANSRRQHRELQRLGALLLAARELDVDAAVEELLRHTEARRLGGDARVEVAGRSALTPHRGREQVAQAHAGHLDRVLQREEQAARGALVRGEAEQLVAVDGDGARR